MKRSLLAGVALALMCAGNAYAGMCNDSGARHQSAVVNVGEAATTQIVPAVTSARTYVCSFVATLAGTTPTITFKYGTKASTDCDTGAVSLSGAMAPTSGSVISAGGGDLFVIPPSNQLCGTTAGTGSSFQGVLTYVQR